MAATAARPENEPGTTVATAKPKRELAPEVQAKIDEARARNQMVAAIRGTQWGSNLSQDIQRSIAEYCRQNNLDPVRHVEILGGRIYLTAELYDEKGAHLIRAGIVRPEEPELINADERLDRLAAAGDAWAKELITRRVRLRIEHGVPETAKAAVIQRFKIQDGATILGVNWCGGTNRKDPVGDAEPTKTAITRARRRAWKQIADVVPGYAEIVRPLEATARIVNEQLPVSIIERPTAPKALAAGEYDGTPSSAALDEQKVPAAVGVAAPCTRCGQVHRAGGDGEDLGNADGSCFRFTAAAG